MNAEPKRWTIIFPITKSYISQGGQRAISFFDSEAEAKKWLRSNPDGVVIPLDEFTEDPETAFVWGLVTLMKNGERR